MPVGARVGGELSELGPGVWEQWAKTYSWRIAVLSLPVKKRLAYFKTVRDRLPETEDKSDFSNGQFPRNWRRELDSEIAELENRQSAKAQA
jgi:hypothetical protein